MAGNKDNKKHGKQVFSAVLAGTLLLSSGGVQSVLATEKMEDEGVVNKVSDVKEKSEAKSVTQAKEFDHSKDTDSKKIYSVQEFEETANWGTKVEAKDDATEFTFDKQYSAVSYKIPEGIDVSKLEKIVCKVKSGDGTKVSLKFFSDDKMQKETAVSYGSDTLQRGSLKTEDIKCIGIMSLDEAAGAKVEIESITFVLADKAIETDKEEVKDDTDKKDEEKTETVSKGAGDLTKDCFKPGKNNNPIATQRYSADPGVMVYNDTVYVYSTNDEYEYDEKGNIITNSYGKIKTINCFSSKDMVNWTDHGAIPVAGKNDSTGKGAAKWANNSWAPCAAHKTINGKEKFFLYFADNGSGIGVLTADSPTGPWTDPLGKQLISRQTPTCDSVEWLFDPAVFVDDDGTGYLYFGGGVPKGKEADPGTARVVQLGDDMTSIVGEPKKINPPYLFEDSGINKIGDKYYYSYCSNWNTSGSGYNTAAIEYMVSDSPMGPFKYAGELFQNPGKYFGVWGNNHHSMFEFKGQLYLAYHARALETAALGKDLGYRTTQIDKVELNKESGKISLTNPTMTGVPQVGKMNPYETVSAATMARQSGIEVKGSGNPALSVSANDWTSLKGVGFEKGLANIEVEVKADKPMNIEVRTGSNSGKLLGTIKVDNTNGEFKTFKANMKNITGDKNIFFVYTGTAEVANWKANPYNFKNLKKASSYGLEETVKEDGSMDVNYTDKWGEIRFEIPETIDIESLSKIIVKQSGDKDVSADMSIKALETVGDENENAVELDAKYGTLELDLADVDKSKLNYFGIMCKEDGPIEAKFDSVVFVYGDTDAKEDDEDAKGIQANVPDLKTEVAKKTDKDFIMGTALTLNELSDDNLMALVGKHFNAVTLGNELKPDANFGYSNDKCPGTTTATLNGEEIVVPKTDFSRADKMLDHILAYNKEHKGNEIKIRGHVLTWHSQTPEWFFHEDYDASKPYVDKETMTKRHEWYIKTVLERYAGKDSKYKDMFYGWDVVNEAVSDGSGTYRHDNEKSSWWAVYKSQEFIINAFRFANKYAPKELELYYNDYNEWVDSKVNGICQLLKDVKNAEGTRIDGMGMQGHYATSGSPSVDDFKNAARKYGSIVDKVQITELDFKASSAYDGTDKTFAAEDTRLAYRYKDIYNAVLDLRKEGINMSNITVWGVIDKNSWLQTSNSVGGASDGKQKQMPLLFDDNYQVKSAYWALVDDTKLEPEIKNFDILQSTSGSFANANTIKFGNGSVDGTATPIWNDNELKVKFTVKQDKDGSDDKDAFTVYYEEDGKVKSASVKRTDANKTENGYEGVVTVPVKKDALFVTSQMSMDFAVTRGNDKVSFNDYTNSQDKKTTYYAKTMLKPYTVIPKGTATVDGDLDDAWKNAVDVPLTINLNADVKADAKLLWDEDNLYIYANVKDSVLNAESTAQHEQDSIEVFIDENNNKTKKYEDDDKQYRVNYLNEKSYNGKKCLEENIQSATKTTDDGYVVEMAIKWTDLTPKAKDQIGLELQINDANASAKRAGTLSWYDTSGQGWENPSVFGTVTLVDSLDESSEENGDLAKAQEELKAAKAALTQAEKKLTDAQKEYDKADKSYKDAQKKVTSTKATLTQAEKEKDKAEKAYKSAKAKYDAKNKEYKAFDSIAKSFESQAAKLEKQAKKAKGTVKMILTTTAKMAKASGKQARKIADSAKKSMTKVKTEADSAKKKLTTAEKAVSTAKKKYNDAVKANKTAEKNYKTANKNLETAKTAKEAAEKAVKEAQEKVDSLSN